MTSVLGAFRSLGGSCEPVLSCLLGLGVVTGSCGGGLWSVCCEQAAGAGASPAAATGGGAATNRFIREPKLPSRQDVSNSVRVRWM